MLLSRILRVRSCFQVEFVKISGTSMAFLVYSLPASSAVSTPSRETSLQNRSSFASLLSPVLGIEPAQSIVSFGLRIPVENSCGLTDPQSVAEVFHILLVMEPPELPNVCVSIENLHKSLDAHHEHSCPPKFFMTASPPGCSLAHIVQSYTVLSTTIPGKQFQSFCSCIVITFLQRRADPFPSLFLTSSAEICGNSSSGNCIEQKGKPASST